MFVLTFCTFWIVVNFSERRVVCHSTCRLAKVSFFSVFSVGRREELKRIRNQNGLSGFSFFFYRKRLIAERMMCLQQQLNQTTTSELNSDCATCVKRKKFISFKAISVGSSGRPTAYAATTQWTRNVMKSCARTVMSNVIIKTQNTELTTLPQRHMHWLYSLYCTMHREYKWKWMCCDSRRAI